MQSSPRFDVLIIEPEPIARYGLVTLLQTQPNLRIAGEADNLRIGRELSEKAQPAVVVLDPATNGGEGFLFLHDLAKWCPNTRAVMYTASEDPRFVQRALRAGAAGYVARREPLTALCHAIVTAAEGGRYVSPLIERLILESLSSGLVSFDEQTEYGMSKREQQIFQLLGDGRACREIADTLGVSIKTVESHQQRLKRKLGVRSSAELRQKAALYVDGARAVPANVPSLS